MPAAGHGAGRRGGRALLPGTPAAVVPRVGLGAHGAGRAPASALQMGVRVGDGDVQGAQEARAGVRERGLEGGRVPFGRFENLQISEESRSRLSDLELETLSPIQRKTFQPIMEGRDVIAKAPTGTGKTLAYCLPVVERLLMLPPRGRAPTRPSWLVLVPTRELAQQVVRELNGIAGKRLITLLAVGGVAMDPQIDALQRGVDVVVATPGRAVDLLRARRMALFDLRVLVLDEADQMLEAGFAQELDCVLDAVPRDVKVQTLMFCATLPRGILQAAERVCYRPVTVQTSLEEDRADHAARQPQSRHAHEAGDSASGDDGGRARPVVQGAAKAGGVGQGIVHKAMRVAASSRPAIVADILAVDAPRKAIIFTNTKLEAVTLGGQLAALSGGGAASAVNYAVLHGDLPQFQRTRVMQDFKNCDQGVLIATDVAARGIHVDELDLIMHCGVPTSASGASRRAKSSKADVVNVESFVHRSPFPPPSAFRPLSPHLHSYAVLRTACAPCDCDSLDSANLVILRTTARPPEHTHTHTHTQHGPDRTDGGSRNKPAAFRPNSRGSTALNGAGKGGGKPLQLGRSAQRRCSRARRRCPRLAACRCCPRSLSLPFPLSIRLSRPREPPSRCSVVCCVRARACLRACAGLSLNPPGPLALNQSRPPLVDPCTRQRRWRRCLRRRQRRCWPSTARKLWRELLRRWAASRRQYLGGPSWMAASVRALFALTPRSAAS